MADTYREFDLVDEEGCSGTYRGRYPRQAALKAARATVAPSDAYYEELLDDNSVELAMAETESDAVHLYDAVTWREEKPADGPDWMPRQVIRADVRKKTVTDIASYLEGDG